MDKEEDEGDTPWPFLPTSFESLEEYLKRASDVVKEYRICDKLLTAKGKHKPKSNSVERKVLHVARKSEESHDIRRNAQYSEFM